MFLTHKVLSTAPMIDLRLNRPLPLDVNNPIDVGANGDAEIDRSSDFALDGLVRS